MELAAIENLIESYTEDVDVTVSRPRAVDQDREDGHHIAVVVLPTLEGKSLVQQYQLVYDALGGHMTTDVHVMELRTYTPEKYAACKE